MYYVDLSGVLSRLDSIITINNTLLAVNILLTIGLCFLCFRIRSKGGING